MIKRFFSACFRLLDGIRRLLLNLAFLAVLLLFAVTFFIAKPSLPKQAVLVLNPQGALVEQLQRPSSDGIPLSLPDPNQAVMPDMIRALAQAKDDPRILALRLDLENMGNGSLAKLQTLRRAIEDFKRSGKPVLASGYSYSQSQYYLAATADAIFLHPMGSIGITGFGAYHNYFHSALEKLNVDVHIFRVGEFKSAVEPFMLDAMSDAAREANRIWLSSLWGAYKRDVAQMRQVDVARIQQVVDAPAVFFNAYHGDSAAFFLAEKLVDRLGDNHDAEAFLVERLAWQGDDDLPEVAYSDYVRSMRHESEPSSDTARVGLIVASGMIGSGEKATGEIGSDTLATLLARAQDDDAVKAVVLRIDSPGGSALASEVIRQAIVRLKAMGKPVVVSMGSLAASGGYWIAANADEIWAQPTTLTGSIGVFGVVPNVTRSLESVGIHTDGVGTTAIADSMRMDRPLSPEVAAVIQMSVDNTYQRFVQLVSEGRKLPEGQVNAMAQGRVWSGVDAKRLGLVDQLGDLPEAVAAAAKRAGIANDYQLQEIKVPLSFPEMLIEDIFGEADALVTLQAHGLSATWMQNPVVQSLLAPLQALVQFNDPQHVYAYSDVRY